MEISKKITGRRMTNFMMSLVKKRECSALSCRVSATTSFRLGHSEEEAIVMSYMNVHQNMVAT